METKLIGNSISYCLGISCRARAAAENTIMNRGQLVSHSISDVRPAEWQNSEGCTYLSPTSIPLLSTPSGLRNKNSTIFLLVLMQLEKAGEQTFLRVSPKGEGNWEVAEAGSKSLSPRRGRTPFHSGLWRLRMGWKARKEEKDGKTFRVSVLSSPSGCSGVSPQNHAPVKLHGHDSGLGKTRKG